MTPEQEAIVRRLCRYIAADKMTDRSFVKLIVSHKEIVDLPSSGIDTIVKDENEQIALDELERRLDKL